MKKHLLIIVTLLMCLTGARPTPASANSPHYTIILNQTRGDECCDPGSLENLKAQIQQSNQQNLTAHFSLRYDALKNQEYIQIIKNHPNHHYGALLEITPSLAKTAGVTYKGTAEEWYQAQNVFLIGYNQDERQQIIDAYMQTFHQVFNRYPTFSTAWMIDAWSLNYLKSEYGILVHQITREQFGTDSYTLYGGPPHYPYWPSENWPLIPDPGNRTQPLIIRQTITDPVLNYGDKSNSFTSQPNDYMLRKDSIDYFPHLFTQAHDQPNPYTFSLVGLENSMDQTTHQEYFRQLEIISQWQQQSDNRVTNLTKFENWLSNQPTQPVSVYHGQTQANPQEKAWWITSANYRVRIRLSNNELSLTDLRLYHPDFTGPYYQNTAQNLGWWVTPFVIDGSRFFNSNHATLQLKNDYLKNRSAKLGEPDRLTIKQTASNPQLKREGDTITITDQDTTIAEFTANHINLPSDQFNLNLNNLPHPPLKDLIWEHNNQPLWGFKQSQTQNSLQLTPFVNHTDLISQRHSYPQLLFPQVNPGVFSPQHSYVYVNNAYAIAGRNPIRLVFYPQDNEQKPIVIGADPQIHTKLPVDQISLHQQHGLNGMLFIDLENQTPLKTTATIQKEDFTSETTIHFAPNCKQKPVHCLTHPQQAYWYLRSVAGDKWRAWQERSSQEETVIN